MAGGDEAMTGEDHIDASAMIEYFQPLLTWLKEQNKGEKAGWTVLPIRCADAGQETRLA